MDEKIKISVGCVNYLVGEVEQLRTQNEKLLIENRAYNNVFRLTGALTPQSQSYSEDRLWQAKKEIANAKTELTSALP